MEKCEHECQCDCHEGMCVHIMACCNPCDLCQKNIKMFHLDEHIKQCHHEDVLPLPA